MAIQEVVSSTTAVSSGTTIIPQDDTIPQITEGDQYMTLSITPTSATSKLVIESTIFASNSNASAQYIVQALFQDATANALAAQTQYAAVSGAVISSNLLHSMTSGTTSSTTFRIRIGANVAGTTTFNGVTGARLFGAISKSSIIIREIAV